MKSKYAGKCPKCGKRFVVGQTEIMNEAGKWVHSPSCFVGTSYQTSNAADTAGRNVPVAIDEHPIINFDALSSAIDDIEAEVKEERVPEKHFTPSVYQSAIYQALEQMVKDDYISQHLVVEAVAGSGKTTTIVHALELIPSHFKVAFVAFNKHIASELGKRAPEHVTCLTLHSLGMSNIRNNISKTTIEPEKVSLILNTRYPVSKKLVGTKVNVKNEKGETVEFEFTESMRRENYIKRHALREVSSICKSVLVDVDNQTAVRAVIDRYGIQIDASIMNEVLEYLPVLMNKCKEDTKMVDFDDMIWLPLALGMTFEQFDFLMVDEAQDMNASQIEFILKSVKPTGHIVAVGDRNQSLYGFRGADTDAIPNIISRLDAITLPLSVTYRCPTKHVELAQRIVPQIEAREDAPEGTLVENFSYFDLAMKLQPGDMVICRTNAPLIRPAFECIRMGKKAIIRGKEIGSQLINLIKRFETDDLGEFGISLAEWYEKEASKYMNSGKEMQAILLTDKVETLQYIMGECSSVTELMSKINLLFNDNNIGIIFSSVHRAKGLEAENVYILRPDLMPHPKAGEGWQQQQEKNALYVAQTRSKANMFIVKGGENL